MLKQNSESPDATWFSRPVLMSTPMKTGGTLFSNLLDGNDEMFVFPDVPYFRTLSQRGYNSSRHMVYDWVLGSRFVGHHPPVELFNFDRDNEWIPVNFEYTAIPWDDISLSGTFRGVRNTADCLSLERYHIRLLDEMEKLKDKDPVDKREIILQTVVSMAVAAKAEYDTSRWKCWAFRSPHTPTDSLLHPMKMQNDDVSQFHKMFPDGKVLFTIRSPQGMMSSRKGHFAKLGRKGRGIRKLYYQLQDGSSVCNTFRMILGYIKTCGAHNARVVKYEDFASHPDLTMREVCRFIGISYSPVMESPSILGVNSHVLSARKIQGNKVEDSRVHAWKKELTFFEKLVIEGFVSGNRRTIRKEWGYEFTIPQVLALCARWFIIAPLMACFRMAGFFYFTVQRLFDAVLPRPQGMELQSGKRVCDNTEYDVLEKLYEGVNRKYIENDADRYVVERKLTGFKSAIDIGARHGFLTRALARYNDHVVALEPDLRAADCMTAYFIKAQAKNITVQREFLEQHKPAAEYDLVFVRSVLHNSTAGLYAELERIAGIMQSGGLLYITYFGFGQQVGGVVQDLREIRIKAAIRRSLQTAVSLARMIMPGVKKRTTNFVSARYFTKALVRTGFIVQENGATAFSLDCGMPRKIGGFIREHEMICRKK